MKHAFTFLVVISLLSAATLSRADDKSSGGNDVVRFGKSIEVGPEESVGDAVCIGCSIHIVGTASGDLVAIGGAISVEGTVRGDAVVVGGNLRMGPNALIHGDVNVTGGNLQRAPGSTVEGEVSNVAKFHGLSGMLWILFVPLIATLVCGVVVAVLCFAVAGEHRIQTVAATLREQPGLTLLAGVCVVVAFIVVMSIVPWTGPLSPVLAILAFVALTLACVVGYTGVSAWAGRGIANAEGTIGAVVAGAVIVGLLQLLILPIAVFGLLALGAAVLSGFGTHSEWLLERLSHRGHTPTTGVAGTSR